MLHPTTTLSLTLSASIRGFVIRGLGRLIDSSTLHLCAHGKWLGADGNGCRWQMVAQMVARGEFTDGDVLNNESWIGSHFEGRIKERTKVGNFDAIIPMITGRAWVMGEATWMLDENDPFPSGFIV